MLIKIVNLQLSYQFFSIKYAFLVQLQDHIEDPSPELPEERMVRLRIGIRQFLHLYESPKICCSKFICQQNEGQ